MAPVRHHQQGLVAAFARDAGGGGGLALGGVDVGLKALDLDAPPGALVLFRMVPRAIAKHVGILTGPDTFLHAYERLGVIEEAMTPTWRRRIAFAFLFPPS